MNQIILKQIDRKLNLLIQDKVITVADLRDILTDISNLLRLQDKT